MRLTPLHAPHNSIIFKRAAAKQSDVRTRRLRRMHLIVFKIAASSSQDTAATRAMAFPFILGCGGMRQVWEHHLERVFIILNTLYAELTGSHNF